MVSELIEMEEKKKKTLVYFLAKLVFIISYPFTVLFSLIFTGVLLIFSQLSVLISKIIKSFERS